MNSNLVAEASIETKANQADVWDALINPKKIKVFIWH